MKYNVLGFSQERLIALGLDLKDAALLRELMDFKATGQMTEKVIHGNVMFWVKYDNLLEQLPIIGIVSADVLARRLRIMHRAGLLDHETVRNKGTFSYYAFTDKLRELLYTTIESSAHDSIVGPPTTEKSEQKTLLTKDPSIKINKKEFESELAEMTPHRRESFEIWLKYKSEKRQSYKQTGFNMLIKKMSALSDDRLRIAVENSTAQNYAGIFEPSGGIVTSPTEAKTGSDGDFAL
jgi:hypothetical protein